MAAPTFVSYTATTSLVTSGTPKTVSVSVQSGDRIVVVGCSEDSAYTLGTPSDGTNTYTSAQNLGVTSYARVAIWTATAASTASLTISMTLSNSGKNWGFAVFVFRGSAGFGASNSTNASTGGPSLGLTTTAANSAIIFINGDWAAVDGASRTFRQVNSTNPTDRSYARDAATHTVYVASYADAGAAGAKTVGLSAPSTQKYAIAAVEVKGSAGSSVTGSATGTFAGSYAAAGTPTVVGTATRTLGPTTAASGRPTKVGVTTGAFGGTYPAAGRPTVVGTATRTLGPTTAASGRRTTSGGATGAFGFSAPGRSTQGTLRRDLHKSLGHAPAAISDYVTAFSPNTASGGWHRGDGGESILGPSWHLFVFNDFFISNGSGGVNALPVNNSIMEVENDGQVYWLNGGNGGAAGTNAFPDVTGGRVVWLKGGWVTSSTSAMILAYVWLGGVLQGYQVMAITGIGTSTPKHSPVYPCGIPDEGINWGGTPYLHNGYVYLHGFHLTNFTAHVCRCALSTNPNAYGSWEVWTGSAWASSGAGTVTIGTGPFGYLSVIPGNANYSTLLASSKEFNTAPGLGIPTDTWSEIRGWSASAPEGPWTYQGVFYQPTTRTDWYSYSGRIERYLGVDRMVAVWSLNAEPADFDPDVYGVQLANARNQLSGTATGSFGFSAPAAGRPTVRGSTTLALTFTAPATARQSAVGVATLPLALSSNATGKRIVNGPSTLLVGGLYSAAGRPTVVAAVTLSGGFSAPASGVPTVRGAVTLLGGFTAPAAARPTVVGASSTSFGFSGPASGVVSGAGSGSATGLFGFTGPAAGRPIVVGATSVTLSFGSAATGRATVVGGATLPMGPGTAAAGRPTHLGAAGGAFGWTSPAAGRPIVVASTSGTAWTFTAPASGTVAAGKTGTATLAVTFVAPASGRPVVRGAGQLSVAFGAATQGRPTRRGSATGPFGFLAPGSGYSFIPAPGIGGLVEGPDMVGAGAIVTGSGHISGGIT